MFPRLLHGLLIISLYSAIGIADQISVNKFSGINNNNNPATIDPSQAQDGLNFDITPGGLSIKKRDGYGVYKALGTGQAMHGGFSGFDSAGNSVQIWGSSRSVYGIVSDAAPTQLVSSMTLNSTIDCANSQSNFYCTSSSRDFYLRTDGATKTWFTNILGTMVESTPDRMVVAGVSGSPNTLFISQSNTFTNFTTGVNDTDAFAEIIASQGSKITHIRWGCGKLLWWKDQSFGYLDFDNQYTAQVKTVSNTIGTFDNTSAVDPGGNVWFRGQDGHTWKYDCSALSKESVDITPNVQASGNRTANLWTQTTQADWQTGAALSNGPSVSVSSSISAGDVVLSTALISTATFFTGSFSSSISTTTAGQISLKLSSDTFVDFSNWTTLATGYWSTSWTTTGNTATCSSVPSHCGATRTANGVIFDDFVIQYTYNRQATSGVGWIGMVNASNQGYAIAVDLTATGTASIEKLSDLTQPITSRTQLSSAAISGTQLTLTLKRNASTGELVLYNNGSAICSATDTTYGTFTKQWIGLVETFADRSIASVQSMARTGYFNSTAIDSSFFSPFWGVFNAVGTNLSSTTFAVRTAPLASGVFTSYSGVVNNSSMTVASNRWIGYTSTITAVAIDMSNPTISTVTFALKASTGTFYSAVKNAPSLTAWSTFGAGTSLNDGTETFYMRSSTSVFTVLSATPSWTAQTNGGLITIATGTYFQVRDDFAITAATQTPTLNDFTVNWYEGAASDQAYMLYFDNAIWQSVAFGAGQSTNNYIFKKDLINDAWTIYNFGAGGMLFQSNVLHFGDTAAGNIFNYGTTTSDNGSAINAYWKSKEFAGPDPYLQTQLTNIDTTVKKDQGSTLTATYTVETSTATSFSISLSSSTQSIINNRKMLPSGKMGYTFSMKYGDQSTSSDWELLGFRIGFTQQPYRPSN